MAGVVCQEAFPARRSVHRWHGRVNETGHSWPCPSRLDWQPSGGKRTNKQQQYNERSQPHHIKRLCFLQLEVLQSYAHHMTKHTFEDAFSPAFIVPKKKESSSFLSFIPSFTPTNSNESYLLFYFTWTSEQVDFSDKKEMCKNPLPLIIN